MNVRANCLSCILFKPCLGIPYGILIVVSVVYYWWLMSRISLLENQNKVYVNQLRLTQKVIKQAVDTAPTYQVPVIPDEEGTVCETVHVALVCMGKCTRIITPTMKSLLYHRQNPVHFHFIVDSKTHHVMTKMFDTWDLPDVKYTCYNAQDKLSKVKWIPNSHYSGVFAMIKLLFPEILPNTLKQVIVLDSDLTFLCDVAELWALFRQMNDDQFIGLVENESGWYLDTLRWPAIGRGFNTGVMLLDLQKIRNNVDWTALWIEAVNDNIDRLKQTTLADQDVINAIIKKEPRIVYNISCLYNVQMSTKSLAKHCYGEDIKNIKIIHWNSPSKYNIQIRDASYFRNIHQSYVNLDGNLLRDKLHWCSPAVVETVKDTRKSNLCASFRAAQRIKLRTHLYYMDYDYTPEDNFDVTLVLQLSMDRLQFLDRLVKYWDGPLSVAIYLLECEITHLEKFIQEFSDTLRLRKNIGYHLVFKNDAVHYPVNYLRNVALENVNTPFVFLMDVDFVPMAKLYDHLRMAIILINPYPQKKCLVVAAFETQRYRASPPRDKQALLARLATRSPKGDVAPFRMREWKRGHRATNYTRWATATKPYEVEWEPDYEPYLVVHRSVPLYDTRFSGFGWNKVSHSVSLRAVGYKAVVLPDAFVVHTPHAPSQDIAAFRANHSYRICLALLKQEFMEDLKKKYNVTFNDEPPKFDQYSEQAKNLVLNQAKD